MSAPGPWSGESLPVSIRLKKPVYEKLRAAAAKHGTPISELMRIYIERGLGDEDSFEEKGMIHYSVVLDALNRALAEHGIEEA